MKSRLFMFGILAIALVFTMTVVSCGGDGDDSGYPHILDVYNLKTTPLSDTVLTKYGLNSTLYNTLKDIAGYRGWDERTSIDDPEHTILVLIYTGQDVSGFNAARGELNEVFTVEEDYYDDNYMSFSSGSRTVGELSKYYSLRLSKKAGTVEFFSFIPYVYFEPAGTMEIIF
jgi:hypothetical protein